MPEFRSLQGWRGGSRSTAFLILPLPSSTLRTPTLSEDTRFLLPSFTLEGSRALRARNT